MSSFIDTLKGLDKDLLLFINSRHTPFWDDVMWTVSGRLTWIPLYLLFAVLIIKDYRKGAILIIIFAVIAIVLSDQAANLIKNGVHRLRPSHVEGLKNMLNFYKEPNGESYMGGDYGFPSNHAANAASLAMYLILLFRNKLITFGLICYVLLVSYSRVYLGVHYPSDVLGGMLLGIITGSVAHKCCMLLQRGTSLSDT